MDLNKFRALLADEVSKVEAEVKALNQQLTAGRQRMLDHQNEEAGLVARLTNLRADVAKAEAELADTRRATDKLRASAKGEADGLMAKAKKDARDMANRLNEAVRQATVQHTS